MINSKMQMHSVFNYTKGMALLRVMATLLLLVASCSCPSSQINFKETPMEGWKASDTLSFPVNALLEEGNYTLSVVFRTSTAKRYCFQQLVVEVEQCWSNVSHCIIDTLDCQLTETDGEVKGKGVSIYSYDYPVDTLCLSVGDSGRVCIRHLMRQNPLKGIYNVGVVLHKVGR